MSNRDKKLGEIAYEAYADSVGWKNYLGKQMPGWHELPPLIQGAWRHAAWKVIIENANREREMKAGDHHE